MESNQLFWRNGNEDKLIEGWNGALLLSSWLARSIKDFQSLYAAVFGYRFCLQSKRSGLSFHPSFINSLSFHQLLFTLSTLYLSLPTQFISLLSLSVNLFKLLFSYHLILIPFTNSFDSMKSNSRKQWNELKRNGIV